MLVRAAFSKSRLDYEYKKNGVSESNLLSGIILAT
jgi:hypothetical protein